MWEVIWQVQTEIVDELECMICMKDIQSVFSANSMCGICHMISLSGKCQIETELLQFQKKKYMSGLVYIFGWAISIWNLNFVS